jgi:exodeoxyribonuclease V alpha subunit
VVASWSPWWGSLLGAQPGEALRMRGRWGSHPQFGRQFHVEDYTTVLPATVQGIRRYLGSGLIKGIGPKLAEKIVDHFGVAALEVIETTPDRLVEVPKLVPKRTKLITQAWAEQKAIKEVMVFLQGVGVSTSLAVRIYKQYTDAAIDVVRTQPYRLAAEVWGIGFKPPTPSPAPWASRTTAPGGSRQDCSSPCRRPPATGIAFYPNRN